MPLSDREVLYQLSHRQSMAGVSYCKDCGYSNPIGMSHCEVCGADITGAPRSNPVNAYSLRAKPMAVFDIDMTLLNNEQRYKDAKRAGIIDKDGKPKRKTRFETLAKPSSVPKSSSLTQPD